jgi:hypothetical protein
MESQRIFLSNFEEGNGTHPANVYLPSSAGGKLDSDTDNASIASNT